MTVTAVEDDMPHWHTELMGWYYRPSKDQFEFWWQGRTPMLTLAAIMLDVMPDEIVMEIRASAMVKKHLD